MSDPREVFAAIAPEVPKLIKRYAAKPDRLWMPEELLVRAECNTLPERHEHFRQLHERARHLSIGVVAAIVLNLLTEEGLPHFHRLLAQHLGYDHESPWYRWTNTWTAEEDRHGVVMHDWLREAHIVDMTEVEKLQHQYLCGGFDPRWESPYMIIAYTVLQERATQVSHAAAGQLSMADEPLIGSILKRVAADEARHYGFYKRVLALLLGQDPSGVLESVAHVMRTFTMPGHTISVYGDLAYIEQRIGAFGPLQYADIIAEVTEDLELLHLSGLTSGGQRAQDRIAGVHATLRKKAERDASAPPRTITVPFLLSAKEATI
jgi:acyl-[acyl-carrier-protein] desaturase